MITTAPTPTTRKPRPHSPARRLELALDLAGMPGRAKQQRNGVFVITFSDPHLSDMTSAGIAPATVWADRIEAEFPHLKVVDTHDSIASWRPGQPVLTATVFVRERVPATAGA